MKKQPLFPRCSRVFVCLLLFSTFTFIGHTQVQQKKWALNGQEIDFSSGNPVVNDLPSSLPLPTFPNGHGAANSFYGPDGNLLFYIISNTIFSKEGIAVDFLFDGIPLGDDFSRSEIGIVPVPGSTCKFYIIYSRTIDAAPFVHGELLYSEFDLTLNNNQGGITDGKRDVSLELWDTDGPDMKAGIAISKPTSNGNHFLYVVSHEGITTSNPEVVGRLRRYTISPTEININPVIVHDFQTNSFHRGYNPLEIDLSHDGSMLATSNINDNIVTIFHLNPATGNLDLTMGDNNTGITNFTMDDGISGVEFTPDNQKLFLSVRGTGIVIRDLTTNQNQTLAGSVFYDNSQIELASNNRMYFVADHDDIGHYDLSTNTFLANAIPGLNSDAAIFFSDPISEGFSLPDQIDGFNYQDFYSGITAECCSAVSPYEIITFTVDNDGETNWTPNQNPFTNGSPIVRVQNQIRVSPNNHLKITNMTFQFAEGANIVVEDGAKLTINGTTLTTTNCEEVWGGIEVWGDADESQDSPGEHGVLTIANNSLVEHAWAAVRMYSTEGPCCGTYGGILYASDSDFKNNWIGLSFNRYENFHPTTNAHLPNRSYIKNCDFTINDDYRFSSPMYGHIRLWAVDGILIQDCSFRSEQTIATLNSYLDRGYAIRSANAAFRLTSTCTVNVPQGVPCPGWNSNFFSGFEKAIWAISTGGGNPFGAYYIDHAHFVNNLTGIRSDAVNNGLIIRSNFDVGNWNVQDNLTHFYWGIYLNSGTGFTIEQNTMTDVGSNFFTTGIQAHNTGSANNQIRNNSFTAFLNGNYATKQNRESLNSNDGLGGLRYFCNTNTQNATDFFANGSLVNHGVATNQGIMSNSVTAPALQSAANTFSHATWDFRNFNVQEPVVYWRHPSDVSQPFQTLMLNAFVNSNAQAANGCALAFPNGDEMIIVKLTPQELADLTNMFNNHKIETGNLEAQLALNLDDGDTQATVSMITNWRDSGPSLKTTLNGISPYLSQAALFATFDRSDILTNQDRFDIFLANPDELRRATTIQYAEQGSNPLPQPMINSLKTAALQNFTVRSELVAKIEGRKAAMGSIADRVLLSISEDYDNFNYTFYRDWLNRKGGFETQLAIIESYINEGNLTQAVALLDDMEQNGNLNTVDQDEFNNFRSIKELEIVLIVQNRTWADLTNAEILQLEVIANSDFALATAQAQGILTFFYDYTFEPYFDPQSLGGQANNNSENGVKEPEPATGQNIHTYPTPARGQITFQLDSPLNSNTMLTITDVNGKMVASSLLQEGGLQFDVSTASLPVGVFYYQVVINGENKTGKIVITR